MPRTSRGRVDYYEIAVRQFEQQILPDDLPSTTVWSYGSVNHPGTFNYPAFTIEAVRTASDVDSMPLTVGQKVYVGFKQMHALPTPISSLRIVASGGRTADNIARMADKGKFDLVVMGSHGHGRLANLVLGSTASKVVAQCGVPVLLVR